MISNSATKSKSLKRRGRLEFAISTSVGLLFLLIVLSIQLFLNKKDLYYSFKLKDRISSIIQNGGNLSVVEHVFNSKKEKRNLAYPFKRTKDKGYQFSIKLEDVLNDLMVHLDGKRSLKRSNPGLDWEVP
jgi:hypothetical protein